MTEQDLDRRLAKLEQAVHDLYSLMEIPSPYAYPDAPTVSGAALSAPSRQPQVAVSRRVLDEALGGNLIEAIKIHRKETGAGLREAKTMVEQAARDARR